MTDVGLSKVPDVITLKCLTDKPINVEQWPMTKEKLQVLEQLVQDQKNAPHIVEFTGTWTCPVFIREKKSVKESVLTDFEAIGKIIQPIGSWQHEILLPSSLLNLW